MSERDIRDLLDFLYAAATSPDGWRPFLDALTTLTGSEAAALMSYDVRDKAGDMFSIYGPDDLVRAEYAVWAEKNPLVTTVADSMRTGTIQRNSPVSRQHWFGCEFYTDYLSRYFRAYDNMGLCILRDGDSFAYVTMMRAPDRPDYAHRDWEALEVLRPHLQRALDLQRRLGAVEVARTAAQEVLDCLPVAVFFLDASRRVASSNAEAERLLRMGDALHLDRDARLRGSGPDGGRLAQHVAAACLTGVGRGIAAGVAFQLRRSHGRAYDVLVSPLGASRRSWLASAGPVSVVVVSDPGRRIDADAAGTLRAIYGLTAAEARLACAVGSGQTPKEAAGALGISVNTVRWTLKQVFAKTGTSRQADLVRLVLGGLATLRPAD